MQLIVYPFQQSTQQDIIYKVQIIIMIRGHPDKLHLPILQYMYLTKMGICLKHRNNLKINPNGFKYQAMQGLQEQISTMIIKYMLSQTININCLVTVNSISLIAMKLYRSGRKPKLKICKDKACMQDTISFVLLTKEVKSLNTKTRNQHAFITMYNLFPMMNKITTWCQIPWK